MVCDRVVVGAPFEGFGVVYPFFWDANTNMYNLEPVISGPNTGGIFGASVAVDEEEILVSDISYELGFGSGTVYSYGRNNFDNGVLAFSNPTTDDEFGFSMNWDNGTAVIGAPSFSSATTDGATYIYYRQLSEVFCDLINDTTMTQNCLGTGIVVNADGSYAIAGLGGETANDRDMMLSAYDDTNTSIGDLKWSMGAANENENELVFGICATATDYFTTGQTNNVNNNPPNTNNNTDVVITRINSTTLTPVWSSAYDFSDNEFGFQILDIGNEIIVIGRTRVNNRWRMITIHLFF